MGSAASVSTLLVRPLVAALAGQPAALEAFYRATDLTAELVADVDARLSPAQFCVAWAEAVRLSGDPTIALRIATATPPGAFGIVEYVCRSAPTLGEALRQWVRYLGLLDDAVLVGLVEEEDQLCVRLLQESDAPAPASHELCFALIVAHARALGAAPVSVTAVEFAHRCPGDLAAYQRWFDAPVRFDAETTQLVMSRTALRLGLTTADASLAAILTRHADALHVERPEPPDLRSQVKRVLGAALRSNDAQIEQVARRLGLTPRSLQRRLKDEGASFQSVREDVRRELAGRYLDDNLSFAEISFLLGFSEPSAFFRAFKRWTGLTPLESRQRARP